ncbi:MAG: helicase domain protein [Chitinophagaceae bacterium]|nr:helicase domain protein [Chitinophagaceae bacterium]
MNHLRLQIWQQKAEWIISFHKKNKRWPSADAHDPTEKSYGIRMKKLRILYRAGQIPPLLEQYLLKNNFPFAAGKALQQKKLYDWKERFEEVKRFMEINSRLPSSIATNEKERTLYSWINTQRSSYKKGKLDVEKWRLLNDSGISLVKIRGAEYSWELRFNEVKDFFDKNGKLPSRKNNKILNHWLATQRKHLKLQQMPPDIEERFEKAGIDLLSESFTKNPWEKVFADIENFILKNGRLPSSKWGSEKEKKLYSWIIVQRLAYKKGKLSEKKYQQLNSIGIFLLRLHNTAYRWNECFKEVEEYFTKFGTLPSAKNNKRLYHWIQTQRKKLKLRKLPADNQVRFERLGIDFLMGKNLPTNQPWEKIFTEVENFIANKGRRPLFTLANEKKLYSWIAVQKMAYKKGKLPAERWKQLNKIGISLSRIPVPMLTQKWEPRFKQAEAFFKKHGKLPSGKENKEVGDWLKRIRIKLKSQKLPADIRLRFEQAGIDLMAGTTNNNTWDKRFADVKSFIKKNRRLPSFSNAKEKTLYTWIGVQKTAYKKGKLPAERWKQLNKIGISLLRIPTPLLVRKWETRFKEAEIFFKKHGRNPTQKENKRLYCWLSTYRTKLKLQKLPAEIQLRFQEVGINLSAGTPSVNRSWDEMFTEVEYFIASKGRLPLFTDANEKKLYSWISVQRAAYKRGRLTNDRWKQLNKIGIFLLK